MSDTDVTQRFSNRVDDYVRYRPSYPPELLIWLTTQATATDRHLSSAAPPSTSSPALFATPPWRIADIGAGTGIFSKLLLDTGHDVTAIEPNTPMRTAAQTWLGPNPRFHSIDARAEATTLPAASIDLITVAQAFHWFDATAVRTEWKRILRPGGLVLIVWNVRRLSGTPFLNRYEKLLRTHGTDYTEVAERHGKEPFMRDWFGPGLLATASFDYHQSFDFEGLRGRLLSSSYAPPSGHPHHEPMLADLRALFESTAENNQVRFDYDTRAYLGHLI